MHSCRVYKHRGSASGDDRTQVGVEYEKGLRWRRERERKRERKRKREIERETRETERAREDTFERDAPHIKISEVSDVLFMKYMYDFRLDFVALFDRSNNHVVASFDPQVLSKLVWLSR